MPRRATSEGETPSSESDEAVFRALYPALRRWAAMAGALDQEPDDLVQEAVLRALRRGPLRALDDPGAYLRRSIINLATDTRRSAGRRRRALALLQRGVDTTSVAAADTSCLERLQPVDRVLLYLVDAEAYSFEEAAGLLGMSSSAARSRASRARRGVRKAMTEGNRTP